jgi:hypothetical protein
MEVDRSFVAWWWIVRVTAVVAVPSLPLRLLPYSVLVFILLPPANFVAFFFAISQLLGL